jgi:hypothetical protein
LQEAEIDQFAWVKLEEAKNDKLLDGIYDESTMVAKAVEAASGKKSDRQRAQEFLDIDSGRRPIEI